MKLHKMNADKALYCIKIFKNCIKIRKNYLVQKDVKNASKIWLRKGTKNNNTTSHMVLNHCYPFGLSLKPSGLKKFLEEGDPLWPILAPPWIAQGGSGRKTTTLVRDHEYFIPTKFHQNPSSGSGEEVENVKSLRTDDRGTDRRCPRLRWAKKL